MRTNTHISIFSTLNLFPQPSTFNSRPSTCPVLRPAWDGESQLKTAAGVNYLYDGDGRRVSKSNGKLYWYGMGSDPLDETDLAGNTNNVGFNEYIFFGGKRIARRDSTNAVNYYFADHLGTAHIIANSSGTVLDDSDFYPFGGERIVSASSGNRYKFTGKERDAESGLDNFGARYNASTMGRFMTPDPSNLSVDFWLPQTWNRYAYALNNPLAVVDRNGLWPWYIHNEIIDEAFPGLSKSQLQSLKTASGNVDKDQSPGGSYKHGMSNGDAVNNTTTPGDTSDYIHQNEQTAEQVQADWIASGHTGIAPGAMTAFGNALHTGDGYDLARP